MSKPEPLPQGDPKSPFCRWCEGTRYVHRDAVLICSECDGTPPRDLVGS